MRRTVVIALACSLSCGGSKATMDGGAHSLTYDFNGVAYAGSLLATATLMSNTVGGNQLGLEASDSHDDMLAIGVDPATPQSTLTTGTYDIVAAAPFATIQLTVNGAVWTASASGGSGSVVITTLSSNEVKGTFAATMAPSGASTGSDGALTNGVFDLTY